MADWNENSPSGTDLLSGGDDAIRQLKTDIRERMDNEHVWTATGDSTEGTHKIADFTASTHDHSNAANGGVLDHTDLTSIGVNTHAQIDTHISSTTPHVDGINIQLMGNGSLVSAGLKSAILIPYACTLNELSFLADQVGLVTIWAHVYTYSTYSLSGNLYQLTTGSTAAIKLKQSFSLALPADSTIVFRVIECSAATFLSIQAKVTRT